MAEGLRLGNLSWLDTYNLCSGCRISRLGYWVSKGIGLHHIRAGKWEGYDLATSESLVEEAHNR